MSNKKVLIVDEDKSIRKSLKVLFKKLGYRAITRKNGLKVLNYVQDEAPHMVLLGLMSPPLNSFDICQNIRFNPFINPFCYILPIVLVVDKDDVIDREKGFECGVSEYLTKPFSNIELFNIIDKYL